MAFTKGVWKKAETINQTLVLGYPLKWGTLFIGALHHDGRVELHEKLDSSDPPIFQVWETKEQRWKVDVVHSWIVENLPEVLGSML